MLKSNLRILIVDVQPAQSQLIEKLLNYMGYYCIATTRYLDEGLQLNRYASKRFDVLIAPEYLLRPHMHVKGRKLLGIQNLFVYSCTHHHPDITNERRRDLFRGGLPEYNTLRNFLARSKCRKGALLGALDSNSMP